MKQLEVQIMGQSYLLGCPDGGEIRLLEAVERVDTAMCKIRDAGKVRARERIAVLASLNLAFELSDHRIDTPVEKTVGPAVVASAVQAAPVASPTPDASVAQTTTGTLNAVRDPVLTSLLERLDNALNDDGQLI